MSRFPALRRSGDALVKMLLKILAAIETKAPTQVEEIDKVARRLSNNVLRMDYVE